MFFGNPALKEDSLALRVAGKLEKRFPDLEFKEFDTVEDLNGDEILYVMDVAKGIRKVVLLNGLDHLKTSKIFSIHDYDLSYELKLLKKLGRIKEIRILCIPWGMDEKKAVKQVEALIKSILFSRSGSRS